MNRRDILKLGTLSLFNTQLVHATEKQNTDNAVIWIWLGGGISHIDFTHPVPKAPVEYRNINGIISTKGNYQLGADWINLAKIGDKLTPVVNFSHRDGNHYTATHWVMTGFNGTAIPENGPQKEPSYGSVISAVYGPNNSKNGISTYVKTSKIAHDDAAWLGSTHVGFETNEQGINNLKLSIDKNRFMKRNEMVDIIDSKDSLMQREHSKLRKQAVQVILGDAASAFDVKKADAQSITLYNADKNEFGKNLLVARRVIEAGSKFVTVSHGGWDMHQDISEGMKNRSMEVDKYIATLITDLENRGMLKSTLVVIASEFGRTPKINKDGGRDHHSQLISLMLAGGNFIHGSKIGEYDINGFAPTSNSNNPFNLTATILQHFNIDKHIKFIDNVNRPRYILEGDVKSIL